MLGGGTSLASQAASAPSQAAAAAPSEQRALVNKYCVTCHNQRMKTAGLELDKLDVHNVGADPEHWEKVLRKLRTGVMPPASAPRPDAATLDHFADWLEKSLDMAGEAVPYASPVAVHRLNRFEYFNAVQDLFGLELDGSAFLPADDSGHGFDNMAEVLTTSQGLLERYMVAAQKVSRLAVGRGRATGGDALRAGVETYQFSQSYLDQYTNSEYLPFGARGVSVEHFFPADGEYVLKVRLQRHRNGTLRGFAERNAVHIRLDSERVARFEIGGKRSWRNPGEGGGHNEIDTRDEVLNVRVPMKAGPHHVTVAFEDYTWATEGIGPSRLPIAGASFALATETSDENGRIEPGVDHLDIEGPFTAMKAEETESRRRIFTCYPASGKEEAACAKTILSTIARRAFRRPLTAEDTDVLLKWFAQGRAEGDFDAGIGRAIERILWYPDFLFRIEKAPTASAPTAARREAAATTN